jgi:hypothetical protein
LDFIFIENNWRNIMNKQLDIIELNEMEVEEVSGGCGGLCVLGAIIAGIGLYNAGVAAGGSVGKFLR